MPLTEQLETHEAVHPGMRRSRSTTSGSVRPGERDDLLPARRRRDDLEVVLFLRQCQTHRRHHQFMVICYENPQPPHGRLP
jgi:hypothetical protein